MTHHQLVKMDDIIDNLRAQIKQIEFPVNYGMAADLRVTGARNLIIAATALLELLVEVRAQERMLENVR